ncbi:hypothetical protein [Kibdelosporangium phytohabitans]|uniref:Uncharacterized protein n=1 Tax=Kibdelosporangium phytohabitans TaxID=860235 RepID=A0A0N9HXJ3_9PSEU|nr:hypothetical protein [Kibdelosporangium phytohabitans]ALG06946.1 hypothetical protein AOZ06_08435 [Kibdelosporangium phytohabitans]MBE1468220.1 hypothetical protein [Kibdelosporangium phytohabitans]
MRRLSEASSRALVPVLAIRATMSPSGETVAASNWSPYPLNFDEAVDDPSSGNGHQPAATS